MAKPRTTARLRFPPWQVFELEDGYAVEDAEGRRLGTFRGRNSILEAREAGLLTLEEARAGALDFARLADLVNAALDAGAPPEAGGSGDGSDAAATGAQRRTGRPDAGRGAKKK